MYTKHFLSSLLSLVVLLWACTTREAGFSPVSSLGAEWGLALYCHRFLGPKGILNNSWGRLGVTYQEDDLSV